MFIVVSAKVNGVPRRETIKRREGGREIGTLRVPTWRKWRGTAPSLKLSLDDARNI